MRTITGWRVRFLKDERGFTLTEMLVTTIIMIVVLFALFGIFIPIFGLGYLPAVVALVSAGW